VEGSTSPIDGETPQAFYGRFKTDKHHQAAKQAFLKTIQLKPDFSPAYHHLAICFSNEGQFVEALTIVQFLCLRVPYCTTAYIARAKFYSQLNQNQFALKNLTTAIEYSPNNPYVFYNLGVVYTEISEYTKAVEAFENAIKLDAEMTGKCYFGIAGAMQRSGNYEKAINYYKMAKPLVSVSTAKWCDMKIIECMMHLE